MLLDTLAQYLIGEFDNRAQAIADPLWYVHLRLWHRPVALFAEDSLTIFAEQANVLELAQPYRQRLLRLTATGDRLPLQVQYYRFYEPGRFKGAGVQPERLHQVTVQDIERLPGCVLPVTVTPLVMGGTTAVRFAAHPPDEAVCCFPYQEKIRQVRLGFEASPDEFLSYDKGIDPATGQAIWGALMGAYRFTKRTASAP
jgi:hypothetical protein